jgi:hypothetical protein
MLPQLIGITNSKDFVERGELKIIEVLAQPQEENNVIIILEVILEDEYTFEATKRVW